MGVLKIVAGKYSAEQTERAVLEYMADQDELFALLPWDSWNTNEVSWYRTGALPTAQVVDPYGTIPTGSTEGTLVRNKVSMIAMNVDVYDFEVSATKTLIDRAQEKTLAASEAIVRKFKQLFVNGDSTANPLEFDGLRKWIDPSMVVATGTNGSPVSFELLDQLINKFTGSPPDAIIVHPRTYLSIKALLRTAYTSPPELMLQNFGRPVLTYDGVPILKNEYIPTNLTKGTGTNLTEIYAVRLGLNHVCGVYLEGMGRAGGVQIENVGRLPDVAATRFRLTWSVSIKVQNLWDVAKIEGITN